MTTTTGVAILRDEKADRSEVSVAVVPVTHVVDGAEVADPHGRNVQRTRAMDRQHGDPLTALLRSFASSARPTRRGVVRTMVGATLSGALGPLLGRGQAEAARNRKRKRNDNKKKNKHNDKKGNRRPEGDAPPPPPAPPAPPTGPGFCPSDPTNLIGIVTEGRIVQTFLPPRGGRLTDAWVTLTESQAGLDLIFDIRTVGPQGVPSNSVLASVQVVDIPQTDRGSFHRTVAAAFNPPAAVTVGQDYALAVTGPDGQRFTFEGVDDNGCPDGTLFRDDEANGVFYEVSADLVFAVSITD